MVALPLVDSNPVPMAAYTASMLVRSRPASPPTNASTTSGWVMQASTPVPSATRKIVRYGGTFRMVRMMRASDGQQVERVDPEGVRDRLARRLHAGGVGVHVDGQADAQVDEQRHGERRAPRSRPCP